MKAHMDRRKTMQRPDVVKVFDDKPGAWFKRGFFVGLGLLAAMPAAMVALYIVLSAIAETS